MRTCERILLALAVVCLAGAVLQAAPADPNNDESKLVATLQSADAPVGEKALACKKLAVYGSQTAAPALAPLLADERLASWARIALEAIPGPACDDVLREAAGKLQGKLAIGAINSIARRGDVKSLDVLALRLKDNDAEVASAAAAALGRLNSENAAKLLEQTLATAPAGAKSAVAEGLILTAEKMLAEGKAEPACKLYDLVRKADLPKTRVVEATRGAILARGKEGAALLAECLASQDKAFFGIALRTAREMKCAEAGEALLAQLEKAPPVRQAMILMTLADRGDVKAAPAAAKLAAGNDADVKMAAMTALGSVGDGTNVEVLLLAAKAGGDLAPTARESLKKIKGENANPALIAQAKEGKARDEAILALAARGAVEAVPVFMQALSCEEEAVRQNAAVALRQHASTGQYGLLLTGLLDAKTPEVRSAFQDVLVAVSRRAEKPEQCAQQLMEAWKKSSGEPRMAVLSIICWFGRPETLPAVEDALKNPDAELRKSVLRVLANWPDSGILPRLLEMAKNDSDAAVKVLAFRTAVPIVVKDAGLQPPAKAAKLGELMALAPRAEEKKLILGELKNVLCAESLALAVAQLGDEAVANEAATAIAEMGQQRRTAPPGIQDALKKAAEAKLNPGVKARIQGMLNRKA